MLFAVFASNVRKIEVEGTRAPYGRHLDYLKPLMEAGRIVLEGRKAGVTNVHLR